MGRKNEDGERERERENKLRNRETGRNTIKTR